MAPTTPLEREAEDLAKEYHNASIATRSMMQAQARLTQILSKHANVAVASIASMVQDIANAKITTSLKQKELASLRAQQAVNQQKHQTDLNTLRDAANTLNQNRTRLAQLGALRRRRTAAEDTELADRRRNHDRYKRDANLASDAERKSRTVVGDLNNQMGIKTSELRNIKLTAFATTVNSANTEMQKLVSAINKTQEQFGLAAGQAASLKVENIVSSFNSYVESVKSLFTGKPEFGVSAEMIEKAQTAYQNEFGGILTTEAARDLAKQARTMGVTTEQLTTARRVFMTQTMGNVEQAKAQSDKFIAEFTKKGLTSKEAMQAISKNSDLMAKNGSRFQQSMARAMIDAKKIGVDLSKIGQFGDNLISDFEGFLESQATLGAMGFNFDSNRLAQIAETGSDADLYGELRSQLGGMGKDITKLRRSERLELEKAYGLNFGEMERMAAKMDAGGGGEEIKTPEELQSESNASLTKIAISMDLMTKLLSAISTGALAFIAANSAITAFSTSTMAGTMVTGLATVLAPIAAGIAAIAAVVTFWKMGSSEIDKGKELYKSGEKGKGIAAGALGGGLMGGAAATAGLAAAAALTVATGGTALPAIIAAAPLIMGGSIATGAGFGGYSATKGDDVTSKPGYGKRSLVTPSGVIALNNKDNIIAYADDLAGTKKLPYGSIANKVADGLVTDKSDFLQKAIIKKLGSEGLARIPAIASKLAKPVPVLGTALGGVLDGYGEYKKSNSVLRGIGKGAMSMGGGLLGNLLGGVGGTFAGGPIGGIAGSAMGGLSGSTIANKLFDKFVPKGIAGNLLGKATGLLGGGGLKEIGANLLGKVGLGGIGGNLLGGLAGGPMGMLGMASPFLKKLPFVGSTLGKLADAPNKLMGKLAGSALGKIGGLFGKKKAPAISAMNAMMPEMGNMMSMLPFLSGTQSTAAQGTSQPQAPIAVDTSGIEKQLNNFIMALSNIQVNMDGTKVGKLLVNSNDAAMTAGVFRAQSR